MYLSALFKSGHNKSGFITKTIRIMKLTIVLLIATCLQVSAKGYSQKVTLKENNISLQKVFQEIRKQTGYQFFYADEVLVTAKNVTINIKKGSIEEALDFCFQNQQLTYTISENTIIVKRKVMVPEVNAPPAPPPPPTAIEIKGKITDDKGDPLVGVSITIKGINIGTSTDANGNFNINAEPNATLIISYVGFETTEVKVGNRSTISMQLKPSIAIGEQIVVVAYGKQKKISITGAIGSIQTKEIKQSPAANLAVSLAGRLPGLTAIQRTGEPGRELSELYIRGVGTPNSQSPIILVDGVERDLNYIDPNEVESITILKDASSTALFGIRGANGVILVTTKRGESEIPEINFTAEASALDFTRFANTVDAYNYTILRNEALRNDGLPYQYTAEEIEKYRTGSDPIEYPNTDWKNILLKKYSRQQRYNLNISGAGKSVKYFVNAGYLKQGGQFNVEKNLPYDPSFKLDRYNFRSNVDIQLNKSLKAFLNVAGYLESENSPAGVYTTLNPFTISTSSPSLWIVAHMHDLNATIPGPVVPPGYGEASGEVMTAPTVDWPAYGQINRSGFIQQNRTNVTATYGMEQNLDFLTKGLSAKAVMSFDTKSNNNVFEKKFFPSYVQVIDHNLRGSNGGDSIYYRVYDSRTNTPLDISNYKFYNTLSNLQAYVNYNGKFNKHALTGLILYQRQKRIQDVELPYNLIGLSTRFTYGYDNKYFLEFSGGYNGSEQFVKGRRFGFFPAISGAWVISNEKFFKSKEVISSLKLRGSYGRVGNDRIGGRRFLYLDDIQITSGGYSNSLAGSLGQGQRVAINLLANKELQWEIATKTDIGLELGLFNSLDFVVDVYKERRDNILISRNSIPTLIGLPNSTLPPVNSGIMENKGYEIQLNYRKALNRNLSVLSKLNFNYAKDIVLFADESLLPDDYAYRYRTTGYPLGQQWGYIVDGYFKDDADISTSPVQQVTGHESRPGNFKYRDLNDDGIVNEKDIAPIGYPTIPRYTFGAAFSVTFKNIDLSVLFQGIAAVNNYYQGRTTFAIYGNYLNRHLDSWTEERVQNGNPILYPRLTTQRSPDELNNTFFNINASYIRLKNTEIGYAFSEKLSKKIGAKQVRIYMNGFNLLTWDKLPTKDVDPEQSSFLSGAGENSYPITRMYNFGVSIKF